MISLPVKIASSISAAYLAVSFHYLAFNPIVWGYDGRFCFIIAALAASIGITGLHLEGKNDYRD